MTVKCKITASTIKVEASGIPGRDFYRVPQHYGFRLKIDRHEHFLSGEPVATVVVQHVGQFYEDATTAGVRIEFDDSALVKEILFQIAHKSGNLNLLAHG